MRDVNALLDSNLHKLTFTASENIEWGITLISLGIPNNKKLFVYWLVKMDTKSIILKVM